MSRFPAATNSHRKLLRAEVKAKMEAENDAEADEQK
jgi:hypothetical protein